ncbi:hypothetical protein RYX36_007306 [Vicia faba]
MMIEGHARIKRSVNLDKGEEAAENNKPVIYEDVSLERGSFLVQQAMRVLDVAVSLAKVADVDKSLGDEKSASDGFQEAINLLESLTLKSEASGLEQRRLSVLDFLRSQLTDDDKQEQVEQTV